MAVFKFMLLRLWVVSIDILVFTLFADNIKFTAAIPLSCDGSLPISQKLEFIQ